MAKRWTRGEMSDFLRGRRAMVATSEALGQGKEYLGRVLAHDRDGTLTPDEAARILAAYEPTRGVGSAVGSVGGGSEAILGSNPPTRPQSASLDNEKGAPLRQ